MIRLDISTLIFIYISCSVITILICWVISGYRQHKNIEHRDPAQNIWRCSVCFHEYVDSKSDTITVCPLCGSYNKREESKISKGGELNDH